MQKEKGQSKVFAVVIAVLILLALAGILLTTGQGFIFGSTDQANQTAFQAFQNVLSEITP